LLVDWAVTCRYAESNGLVGTIVGAGVDLIQVPALPQAVGIMLAVRLGATVEEFQADQTHELAVQVQAPDGQPVRTPDGSESPPITAQFSGAAQQIVPGWLVTPMFAIALQWLASEAGTYTILVRAGLGEPSRSPVHVLEAGAPPTITS
jgi:hypothetical protein